jgi:hypothetical protein
VPLVRGKSAGAFNKNVSTLMGEVGESPHVQSRKQALAIAYSEKRRAAAKPKRALRNGQVSDRARERMKGGGDEDRLDASSR